MSSPWSSELGRFLGTLRDAQDELLATMHEKSVALRELDEARLATLLEREEQHARKLRGLLKVREQVLSNARKQGWKVDTLGDLVKRLPSGERPGLETKLGAVRDAARQLRHESWTQWVVSHRCSQHADELVALVAGGGEVDPTYGQRSRFGSHGNDAVSAAMLDAEA
jgi:hypothetical protein